MAIHRLWEEFTPERGQMDTITGGGAGAIPYAAVVWDMRNYARHYVLTTFDVRRTEYGTYYTIRV